MMMTMRVHIHTHTHSGPIPHVTLVHQLHGAPPPTHTHTCPIRLLPPFDSYIISMLLPHPPHTCPIRLLSPFDSFIISMNLRVPERAMVPRLDSSCSRLMPMPESLQATTQAA